MTTQKKDNQDMKRSGSEGGYQTPVDPASRHTGMYEESDAKDEARPESGTSNTGIEGAPNQGTEKR